MSPLYIVILAAGLGTRMHSDMPKVLQPLAGKPLLQHVIDTTRALLPAKRIVVYGHGGEAVKAAIKDPDIIWIHQATQLGTGDAVKCALSELAGGTMLVLYGDVPLISAQTLSLLVQQASHQTIALLTDTVTNPTGYGRIVRDTHGRFVRIVEHKDTNEAERCIHEINTGIAIFPTAQLAQWLSRLNNHNVQQEYYLTDIFAMAVSEGVHICTVNPEEHWEAEGVNNKRQLAALERVYQQQYAYRLLESGVTIVDPSRIDIRGTLLCDKDVLIDVNVVFEGKVTLGPRVRIGANCVLKDVDIEADCVIAPFSHLEGAYVGCASQVGPFARLRPGTKLAESVRIGNFVEIKKSTIEAKTKVNHLSYIGDARIGENTNIGAGTVTCNYDGVNKSVTEIGANVFIGSGSMLVAPLRIGDWATIGAGSTIKQGEVPAGKLTLERGQQLTIEGWLRPTKKS